MKKTNVVIVVVFLLGWGFSAFAGWQSRQGEVDYQRKQADQQYRQTVEYYKKLAETEVELQNSKLELNKDKLALATLYDIFKLPWITEEKILRQFGVKVSGAEINELSYKGVKIDGYDPNPDELLIIFNVLSSLPSKTVDSIHGITIAYKRGLGVGGYYNSGTGDIVLFYPPDSEGANTTDRRWFIRGVYHEVGHAIYFSLLTQKERESFEALHQQSLDGADFATSYGKSDTLEDYAEIFASYCINTDDLLKKASQRPLLGAKLEFVSKFLNQYKYQVDNRGNIWQWHDGKETVWLYRSRVNPGVETLFK